MQLRYRDLLAVLIAVALAAWLLASPSPQVKLPNSVAPDSGGVILDGSRLVPNTVMPPQSLKQSLVDPKGFAADWDGRDPKAFAFTFSVTPGPETDDFEVAYRGPVVGYKVSHFEISNGESFGLLKDPDSKRSGPGAWKFQASDLLIFDESARDNKHFQLVTSSEDPKGSTLLSPGTWFARAYVSDPRADRFTRFPEELILESPPVELK